MNKNTLLGLILLFVAGMANAQYQLAVFHNNDGESRLVNAGSDTLSNFGGAARFKSRLDSLRQSAMMNGYETITLSSGDNFLAGPAFNASLVRPAGSKYYDAIAIDSFGYDALCLGNHDFDFGPQILANFIQDVDVNNPVFLSSNLDFTPNADLAPLFGSRIKNYEVFTKGGATIAVVGATTPGLRGISSPGNVGVGQAVRDSIQKYVGQARMMDGAEVVIVISHLQDIGEDTALAKQLTGVDVMIAGGGDELLANPGDLLVPNNDGTFPTPAFPYPYLVQDADSRTIPLVTTPGNYTYVGQLLVTIDTNTNIVTVDAGSGPVRVSGVGVDSVPANMGLQMNVVDSVLAYESNLAADVIASNIGVDLDGRRVSVRTKETNQGNLGADALWWQANELRSVFGLDTIDVGLQNGGGIRNDEIIPAGSDISALTTFDINPFGNFVSVDTIEVSKLKAVLEQGYRSVPGQSGGFLQVAGLEVEILPSGQSQFTTAVGDSNIVTTPGGRVKTIILTSFGRRDTLVENFRPEPGRTVMVATNDFSFNNGDFYPFNLEGQFTRLGVTYQQALYNYIKNGLGGTINATNYPESGEGRITIDSNLYLNIFHNNDGESRLVDAGDDTLMNFGGAARFKSAIDSLRATSERAGIPSITLSSGDNFLAGPAFNASLVRPAGAKFYDAIAIDSINYDALCLGNHDFDFGPQVLADFIQDVDINTPVFLSSNIDFSPNADLGPLFGTRIKNYEVFTKGTFTIAVVGATTPTLRSISSPGNVGIGQTVGDSIQKYVDQARMMDNADIVIVISHLQDIGADTTLAKQLTDVDVIIAGGGDELLANPGDLLVPNPNGTFPTPAFSYPVVVDDADGEPVPIVTTPGNYTYIGNLLLRIDTINNTLSVDPASGPIRVSGIGEDSVPNNPGLQTNVVDSVLAYEAGLASDVIATGIGVDLDGRRASVRTMETNQGNLGADALLWQANTVKDVFGLDSIDVGLQNGGGIRNDQVIPAGSNISALTTFDINPFGNFVSVDTIESWKLKDVLEQAYRSTPGQSGGFLQVAGLQVTIDTLGTSQVSNAVGDSVIITTPGSKVTTVVLTSRNRNDTLVANGAVVDSTVNVLLATNDFSFNNGDSYPFNLNGTFTRLGVTYQQALYNYIKVGLNGVIDATNYPEGGEGRINGLMTSAQTLSAASQFNFMTYPNPTSGELNISFELPKAGSVEVQVIDLTGQIVATPLSNSFMGAGRTEVSSALTNLNAGLYFITLQYEGEREVRKIVLTH